MTSLACHLTFFKTSAEGNDLILRMSMWTALRNYLFFLQLQKKNHEMACLLLSFGAGTNPFALFFGDSVIFFLWFNLLEFLWIYFTEIKKSRQNLILQSSDGSIIKHHLSLSLSQTECNIHQIQKIKYIQQSVCSVVIYPSAITMTKSLCYHQRMTIFQNN